MAENAACYWLGTVRRIVGGVPVEYDVCRCSPGDWPEIRAELPKGEAWSTLRCGTELLAFGPFRSPTPLGGLLAAIPDRTALREGAAGVRRQV